jgi:hypothetical protein
MKSLLSFGLKRRDTCMYSSKAEEMCCSKVVVITINYYFIVCFHSAHTQNKGRSSRERFGKME